jgi:hypothetical protein
LEDNKIRRYGHVLRTKNPGEGLEYENKRKLPKRETKIKMGTTAQKRCHKEGRKNMGRY